MTSAEIELKFCVPHAREFHEVALRCGFAVLTPRTLEQNILLDTPDRSLLGRHHLLRLRQYGGSWVLTHKRPPEHEDSGARYKERVETETDISDGEAMQRVFSELGYGPVFRYEKFRTEFRDERAITSGGYAGGHLVLDETPIGVFAELEGDPAWIDESLARLGVASEMCFTDSYGRMFLDWRQRSGSTAQNMTFAEIEQAKEQAAHVA